MSMFRPLSSTVARSFARAAHVHARASSAAASKPAAAVASVMGRKDQDRAGAGARRWATSPLGSRSMSTPLAGGSAEAAPAGGQPAAPAGGQPAGLSPPAQAVIVDEQNFNAVVQTLAPKGLRVQVGGSRVKSPARYGLTGQPCQLVNPEPHHLDPKS